MYSLSQRLSRQGISLLMTTEVPELFGTRRLSEFAGSHLADNVIMLSYFRDQGQVKPRTTRFRWVRSLSAARLTVGATQKPAMRLEFS